MKTNLLKNFLKTAFLVTAVLLSFVGFGRNPIDKPSCASSLASVSKTPGYKWEGLPAFEEDISSTSPPVTCMTLSTNVTNLTCSGDRNGAIDLTVLGNSGPFAYDWQATFNDLQGATNQDLTGLPPGTYTVTVISADGCSATTTVVVTAANVSPHVTIDQTFCFGQPTILTASGASSYSWNTGATTSTITAIPGNNPYSVIGTASNGCSSASGSLFVSIYTSTISATSQTICASQSVTLYASGAGISYTWTPGGIVSSSISVTPSVTTVYTVTGTDACSNTASTTATVTTNSGSAPSVTISGSTVVCTQNTYTYNASGASSYSWTLNSNPFGGNTSSISISGLGVHPGTTEILYVTGTDNTTGCTNTASLTLTNPAPTFTLPNVFSVQSFSGFDEMCSGTSYTINAAVSSGSTYTWSPSLTGLNPVVSPTVTTNYTLSVSNASCTVNGTFDLRVNATPTITLTSPITVCKGINYVITPTVTGTKTGTFYDWSPSTGLSSTTTFSTIATISGDITYTLTVSNGYQYNLFETPQILVCQDSKAITFSVLPSPTVTISGNPNVCPGQDDTLKASGATSYIWSSPTTTATATTYSIDVKTTGVGSGVWTVPYNSSEPFTVIGTDGNGCKDTASFTVSAPVPTFTMSLINIHNHFDAPLSICSGTSYTINAQIGVGETYTWTPNLGSTLNPVITPTASSEYELTVSNGTCTASGVGEILVVHTPSITVTSSVNICAGNSYTLTPTTAGTNTNTVYSWSPGAGLSSTTTSTTVATPESSTIYSLVATNSKPNVIILVGDTVVRDTLFCRDTASVDVIIISNPPVPTINYSSVCDSNFTTLSIPSPNSTYTYTWNGPCFTDTGSSVNVNTVGIYTVSVTNSCGVVTTNTISVLVVGNIVAGFQTYINFLEEGTNFIHFENLSLGNNLIYDWTFGNGDTSVIVNPNEVFDTVGVFNVHLYDSDSLNCKDTASATVVLSGHNTILIIPNKFTPNNDNVDDVFAINGSGVSNFTCQISDKWGNFLYQWNNLNGSWNGKASNGQVFANGNYFYLLSYTDYNGVNKSRSGIVALKK